MKKTIIIIVVSIMVVNLYLPAQSVDKEIRNLTCKAYLMNSITFWE